MDQRNLDARLDGGRHAVHRVRAEHQEVGPAVLEHERSVCEERARLLPAIGVLQALDLVEIDAVEDEPGGMEPAELLTDRAIDDLVVGNGRLPAHPAEQADRPHG